MSHHMLAAVCLAGSCLDVLGSMYLAYDLLGGSHGPLRLLTRAVTYSIVFTLGYGAGMNLLFGLAAGIATGVTLSIELHRAGRGLEHYSLAGEAFFSAVRGAGFGVGLYPLVGLQFAALFALLVTVGQVYAYSRGIRPSLDYTARLKPRLSRRQFWATLVRTVGYMVTALLCSALVHHFDHAWTFALRLGLVTGLVTGVGVTMNPFIEYYADNLPEKWLGACGVGLILCGFALQSIQYWLTLLDLPVR